MAGGAFPVGEAVGPHRVAVPLDERFSTVWTIRVFAVGALHVADVDKPEAGFHRNLAGAQERAGRRGGQMLELVLRKEARKVQRRFDPGKGTSPHIASFSSLAL